MCPNRLIIKVQIKIERVSVLKFLLISDVNNNTKAIKNVYPCFYEIWELKIAKNSFSGNDIDTAYSIQQTNDGGYIVAGYTDSNDGDVSGNHGEADYWIVKLGY